MCVTFVLMLKLCASSGYVCDIENICILSKIYLITWLRDRVEFCAFWPRQTLPSMPMRRDTTLRSKALCLVTTGISLIAQQPSGVIRRAEHKAASWHGRQLPTQLAPIKHGMTNFSFQSVEPKRGVLWSRLRKRQGVVGSQADRVAVDRPRLCAWPKEPPDKKIKLRNLKISADFPPVVTALPKPKGPYSVATIFSWIERNNNDFSTKSQRGRVAQAATTRAVASAPCNLLQSSSLLWCLSKTSATCAAWSVSCWLLLQGLALSLLLRLSRSRDEERCSTVSSTAFLSPLNPADADACSASRFLTAFRSTADTTDRGSTGWP